MFLLLQFEVRILTYLLICQESLPWSKIADLFKFVFVFLLIENNRANCPRADLFIFISNPTKETRLLARKFVIGL